MTRDELERRLRANEQRLRATEGLALRPNLLARFELVTGRRLERETEFLSVPESDLLVQKAYERAGEVLRDAVWRGFSALAVDALAALADRVGDARFYLAVATTSSTGLPQVPAAPLLRHIGAFWMPEEEDVLLVSRDADEGLLLEWCDHWVELRTWGWLRTLVDESSKR